MGMNDDGLSPREHTDMRDLVLAGAQRIKPAGAHRAAFTAGAVALALVAAVTVGALGAAGLFGSGPDVAPMVSPSATATQTSTPSPTSTPTATPLPTATTTPTAPAIVFGGDCTRMLADDVVASIVGPGAVVNPTATSAFNVYSDIGSSVRLLGGLTCGWSSPDSSTSIGVTVYPLDVVAPVVRERYSSSRCFLTRLCDSGREIGEFWVAVSVRPASSADDFEQLQVDADAMAATIFDRVAPNLAGGSALAAPRQSDWWTLGDCAALTSTVESVTGGPLDPVFPGDAVPEGADWDVLVEAGVDQWCPWNRSVGAELVMVEIFAQPGIGAPGPEQVTDGTPIAVGGADAAWYVTSDSFDDDFTIVAVAGANRVMVRYRDEIRTDFDVDAVVALTQRVLAQLG